MVEELKPLDVSDLPEVRRLVEEVRAADRPRVLQIDQKDAAVLTPASNRRKSSRRGRPTSADDPLWNIVGIADSKGPGDVSEHVDAYLAEAYLPNEE